MSLAEVTKYPPFSNGTEGYSWMESWCDNCAHDHEMHDPSGDGGCPIVASQLVAQSDDYPEAWPEAWLPEPPETRRLPPMLVCLHFQPCEPCGGDPWGRAARSGEIAEVQTYWRTMTGTAAEVTR